MLLSGNAFNLMDKGKQRVGRAQCFHHMIDGRLGVLFNFQLGQG